MMWNLRPSRSVNCGRAADRTASIDFIGSRPREIYATVEHVANFFLRFRKPQLVSASVQEESISHSMVWAVFAADLRCGSPSWILQQISDREQEA
ncbi:hypothetical protein GDO78_004732 [Eleutherodactylus coqui]|uniref:Uncharacterized protein n=1 Tax=Eleutherodactylus coqui TaxID=57060 RepID=A0A8J6K087_ELECQ|nr:hypothetical protein GDO78_004732 [Eleutherodactylus coqui]